MSKEKVALITGGAKRIGRAIVERFHHAGYSIFFSYHHSQSEAQALQDQLLALRPNSAACMQIDLSNWQAASLLVDKCHATFGTLDVLVNSASSFYPTPLDTITHEQINDLMASNCLTPLTLCQSAAPLLTTSKGSIVNVLDIHVFRPMPRHVVYTMAKTGQLALTTSLALDLAPAVRVNGIAPGTILLPESNTDPASASLDYIMPRIPLGRIGAVEEIAGAALYLARDATYTTGQVLCVDGGRHLTI